MDTAQLEIHHHVHSHHPHWSADQKVAAVLRLLKGEPVHQVSEELGISVRRLERWQRDFLAAGACAMAKKKRPSFYEWVAENSSTVLQWMGLLLALVIAIGFLAMFLRSASE